MPLFSRYYRPTDLACNWIIIKRSQRTSGSKQQHCTTVNGSVCACDAPRRRFFRFSGSWAGPLAQWSSMDPTQIWIGFWLEKKSNSSPSLTVLENIVGTDWIKYIILVHRKTLLLFFIFFIFPLGHGFRFWKISKVSRRLLG